MKTLMVRQALICDVFVSCVLQGEQFNCCGSGLGRGQAAIGKESKPICHIHGWMVTRLRVACQRRWAASDYRQVSWSVRQMAEETDSGNLLIVAMATATVMPM